MHRFWITVDLSPDEVALLCAAMSDTDERRAVEAYVRSTIESSLAALR